MVKMEVLEVIKEPILVTLVPRHMEMEEFLRHQGYGGDILCLDQIMGYFRENPSQ